ncbi:hypothetical protein PHJA_000559700 [Phtheirospermum japonicum]|uniref:DUF6821 domain-containing protein n=1 Tax=Phtheirospermum japonicum TaxID=374723 RepID=A0A830B915_9LAMI|nr:hypothetical protein PHJA_000559700 [Phtheirospermum japonicum]
MNSLDQTDLQDWEFLPEGEFILDSKSLEHSLVEINPSQASKEIETLNTAPCHKSSEADSIKVEDRDDGVKLNVWKWSLTGIGTICSFGVAAASVCIIILGNHRKNNLQFHIYTNDKMIKNQHSRKLDEAIAALGGAIVTKARVTVGGYYDT